MTDGLDRLLPTRAHRTRHDTVVAADPATAWNAILAVTPDELPLTRLLVGIRGRVATLQGAEHGGRAPARDRGGRATSGR